MLALVLAPIYFIVNFYIARWLLRWMKACHPVLALATVRIFTAAFYSFLALSPLCAFLISGEPWHRFFKVLSNYWFGTFFYIILTVLFLDALRFLLKRTSWIKSKQLYYRKIFVVSGIFSVLLVVLVSVYGICHGQDIQLRLQEITVEKSWKEDEMTIVLLSDLHFGYSTNLGLIQKMVDQINEQNADLICIAGDIFDNEYEAIGDPDRLAALLSTLKSRYGTYACYGNHDVSEKILAGFTFHQEEAVIQDPRFEAFLQKAGIILLDDEVIKIDDSFYLAGRKDPSKARKEGEERLSAAELLGNLDKTLPTFVLDHQPKELSELAAAGVDLSLSGHTHNGQMFPGNLLVSMMWENPYGYLQVGNMASYVTSGAGVWGPAMRVGTDSEIVVLRLYFR